jgi:hypothetical protein
LPSVENGTMLNLEMAYCQKCGGKIGQFVEIDGLTLFRMGGLLIPSISAICLNCGEGFHWSVKEQFINQHVKHALKSILAQQ